MKAVITDSVAQNAPSGTGTENASGISEKRSPIQKLRDVRKECEGLADRIQAFADKTRAVIAYDEIDAATVISTAGAAIRDFRAEFEIKTAEADVPQEDWKTRDELDHVLDVIESKMTEVASEKTRLVSFLRELADLLRRLEIEDENDNDEEIRFKGLRDAATEEITAASEKPDGRERPAGEPVAYGWLKTVATLKKNERAERKKELTIKGYQKLSDFVGVLRAGWIPETPLSFPLPDRPVCHPQNRKGTQVEGDRKSTESLTPISPENDKTIQTASAPRENKPSLCQQAEHEGSAPQSETEIENLVEREDVIQRDGIVSAETAIEKENAHPTGDNTGQVQAAPLIDLTTAPVVSTTADNADPIQAAPIPDLASAILTTDEKNKPLAINRLVWNLLNQNELAIAYHLMKAMEVESAETGRYMPPASEIELLVLCPYALFSRAQVMSRVYEAISSLAPGDSLPRERQWIRFAWWFRLAVFTPHAVSHFDAIECPHPALNGLIQIVNEIVNHGQAIEPGILNPEKPEKSFDIKETDLKRRVEEWKEKASHYTVNFAPASAVWREWFKPGQWIGRAISVFNEMKEPSTIIQQLNAAITSLKIEDEIDSTNRRLGKFGRIDGKARVMLRERSSELLELVEEAIGLYSQKPVIRDGIDLSLNIKRLDTALNDVLGNDIHNVANADISFPAQVAIQMAERSIRDVQRLLTEEHDLAPDEINPDVLFGAGALRAELPFHEKPFSKDDPFLSYIVTRLTKGIQSPNDAFDRLSKDGDHAGTRILCDYEHLLDVSAKHLYPDARERRDQSLASHRDSAKQMIASLRRKLSDALNAGTLTEENFSLTNTQIEEYERNIERASFDTYNTLREQIKKDESVLVKDQDRMKKQTQERLKQIRNISADDRQRIEQVIDKNDFHTATDYMDRIADGDGLPAIAAHDVNFCDFFGNDKSGSSQLYSWMEREKKYQHSIIRNIEEQTDFGGVFLSAMPSEEIKEFLPAVEKWFECSLHRRTSIEDIKTILTGLGMSEPKPALKAPEDYIVTASVSKDCSRPVAAYGTEAHGKYTVICLFGDISPQKILDRVGTERHGGVMVLFFGRMSTDARRLIAKLCRTKLRTVLVIDDILMGFLAGMPGSKFSAVMTLAMPFTHFMPYTKTGSLLPDEMFFGRVREIAKLKSMGSDSSSLLYGGRQIGKTVLLKRVEREVNAPKDGHIAKLIDLKDATIGSAKPLEDVWTLIYDILRDVVSDSFGTIKGQATPAKILQHIEAWLSDSAKRRTLFLLDEADEFLKADGQQDFRICTSMKGLMERTDRRFKVVFAGLHNVQRATKASNNPIAHFGEPICIGPLLHNGESRLAQELIELPMACLGLFFESLELPVRILAQTNYYPNLIQIYCANLVEHMFQRQQTTSKPFPPYTITDVDVKAVYESDRLREELRDRFDLTLQLDPRFRLIANIMAYEAFDQSEGFTVSEMREQAIWWWKAGFRQVSMDMNASLIPHDAFRNLLDEMVGLGILQKAKDETKYRLRSLNVASLLGTPARIEETLSGAEQWELPVQYDAQAFRRLLPVSGGTASLKRSCFTAEQERAFGTPTNDVVLIVGNALAGIGNVRDSLATGFGENAVRMIESPSNTKVTSATVNPRAADAVTTVFVVSCTDTLPKEWVNEAKGRLERLNKRDAFTKVVFTCPPQLYWNIYPTIADYGFATVIFLHPMSDSTVRQWTQDAELGEIVPENRSKLFNVTGNWPELLNRFVDQNGSVAASALTKPRLDNFLAQTVENPQLSGEIGLDIDEPRKALLNLLERGDALSDEEMASQQAYKWAADLSLLRQTAKGWVLDPIVEQLLYQDIG